MQTHTFNNTYLICNMLCTERHRSKEQNSQKRDPSKNRDLLHNKNDTLVLKRWIILETLLE